MKVYSKRKNYFQIYDLSDNYIFEVEGYKELAEWFGMTIDTAHSSFCRIKNGQIKSMICKKDNKKYKVYRTIEKGD